MIPNTMDAERDKQIFDAHEYQILLYKADGLRRCLPDSSELHEALDRLMDLVKDHLRFS